MKQGILSWRELCMVRLWARTRESDILMKILAGLGVGWPIHAYTYTRFAHFSTFPCSSRNEKKIFSQSHSVSILRHRVQGPAYKVNFCDSVGRARMWCVRSLQRHMWRKQPEKRKVCDRDQHLDGVQHDVVVGWGLTTSPGVDICVRRHLYQAGSVKLIVVVGWKR